MTDLMRLQEGERTPHPATGSPLVLTHTVRRQKYRLGAGVVYMEATADGQRANLFARCSGEHEDVGTITAAELVTESAFEICTECRAVREGVPFERNFVGRL